MVIKEKEEILGLIGEGHKILITTKANPDHDEVAAACALRFFIQERYRDKTVDVAASLLAQNRFKFIPGASGIVDSIQAAENFVIQIDVSKTKVKELSYDKKGTTLEIKIKSADGRFTTDDVSFSESSFSYDLIITLGATDMQSIGDLFEKNRELFFNTTVVNIDRQARNTRYGQINAVYLTATSLSEIVHTIVGENLTAELATCLLSGLIAATNSFQSPQVTPDTLQLASRLMIAGAPRDEIVNHLFRTKDMNRLKVWGKILSRLQHVDKKIVYSDLQQEEITDADVDLYGMVDDLVLASPEAEVVLFFHEGHEGSEILTTVYAYARENYDLPLLLAQFSPTGSRQEVVFKVNKNRVEAEKDVVEFVRNRLKMIGG